MRLALVTQDFPPDVGGTQTYAYELARRLAGRCDALHVIAPARPGAEAVDAAFPGTVHRVRASYDLLSVAALPTLLRLIRGSGLDATFHVQWPTTLAAELARALGWRGQVFLAAHGRELLLRPLGGVPVAGAAYDALRRHLVRRADALFPVSRYTAGLLRDLGADESRIHVIHNGTNTHRFQQKDTTDLRERLRLQNRPVLLTVSRLVPRKGIDTVLAALPEVVAAVPDVTYLIGGTGPDRERLEALVEQQGLEPHVRFLERVPDAELAAHYSLADVFVMPSRQDEPYVEGFGLVFLEANACGTPVVGARTGGIPDAVLDGQTGLLVPPDAPASLADALVQLLRDPARAARLGEQGRQRVLNEATWEHVADRLFAHLQRKMRGR